MSRELRRKLAHKKNRKKYLIPWPDDETMAAMAAIVKFGQAIAMAADGTLVVTSNADPTQGARFTQDRVDDLERRGWITLDGDVLRATPKGAVMWEMWDKEHYPGNPLTHMVIPAHVPLEQTDGNPGGRPPGQDASPGRSGGRRRQVVAQLLHGLRS